MGWQSIALNFYLLSSFFCRFFSCASDSTVAVWPGRVGDATGFGPRLPFEMCSNGNSRRSGVATICHKTATKKNIADLLLGRILWFVRPSVKLDRHLQTGLGAWNLVLMKSQFLRSNTTVPPSKQQTCRHFAIISVCVVCCLEIIFSLVWMCVAGAEDIGSITMGSSGCWHRGSQFFPESAPFPDARAQGLFYPVVSVYTFIFCFGIVSCFLWCPVSQKRPPVRLSWWSFDGVPGRKLMNKMEYDKYLFVNFSHSKHGLIMTPAVPICFRSQGCPTSCGSKLLHFGSPIVTWRTPLRILRRLQAAFLLDTESYTWVQNNCWSRHYSLLNLLFTGTKLWITDWERLLKHHEHCRVHRSCDSDTNERPVLA